MSENVKIEIKDLNFYYDDFQALKNINMKIAENEITALIGPSGCGKSTFLRVINRMNDLIDHTKVKGEVIIDGQNLYSSEIDVVELRKKVGMVFQQPNP